MFSWARWIFGFGREGWAGKGRVGREGRGREGRGDGDGDGDGSFVKY